MTLNGTPTQTILGTIQGSRDSNTERTAATLPQIPRSADVARPAATNGTHPTRMAQRVVNNKTRSSDGRRGQPPLGGEGAQEEEGRRASVEGAPDAPGEAGRLE